jgi:hypothetical protein
MDTPAAPDHETPMSEAMGVDAHDAEANTAMAVLAYLGLLALIPLLAARESPFVRFHQAMGSERVAA